MKRKKEPPGYPGDEAIRKAFSETLHEFCLEKGLSLKRPMRYSNKELGKDAHPLLPRALGIVVKQLREQRNLSRKQ